MRRLICLISCVLALMGSAATLAARAGETAKLQMASLEGAKHDKTKNNRATIDKANLDRFCERVREEWQIPGMGVAVVQDGETILCKGYGKKDPQRSADAVDEHTVFHIGSISKSFTATLVAMLVDQGLLKWDDRVADLLPGFKMSDPYATEHLQVRDLALHRTGLPGDAGTYLPSLGYGRDEISAMIEYIKAAYTFRGEYQYNNITFIPLAAIIEKVSGKSWEQNIRERIFQPLGMSDSVIGSDEFAALFTDGKAALPHFFYLNKKSFKVVPLRGEAQAPWWMNTIGPAGGICCSAADLSRYAQFHLNGGRTPDGRRLVSEKQMQYLHTGQMLVSQDEGQTTIYSPCWRIEQSNKGRIYSHTGTTWGMTGLCCFIPEHNMTVVVLENSEVPTAPRMSILKRSVDLALGLEDHDYCRELKDKWIEAQAHRKARHPQKAAKPEHHDMKSLVGTYEKGWPFGDAKVTLEDGKLYLELHNSKGWKRQLKNVKGDRYSFYVDGKTFTTDFIFENGRCTGIDLNMGGGEDFGPWTRVR